VEVFAGSAKLLFAKEPSKYEVLNDINGDLTNFFCVAKHRPAALAELFDHELIHAARFKSLRAAKPDDELQRALRFAYLIWYSYGAQAQHFAGASAKTYQGGKALRSLDRVASLLEETSRRLRHVLIEQRGFQEILLRYDSPVTWFYLDPPYVHFQSHGQYRPLEEEERINLFGRLAGLSGNFLMSFDDCSEVRGLARQHGFHLRSVKVGYTLGSTPASRSHKACEVLISKLPIHLPR
jgi:DNA adenine methylase